MSVNVARRTLQGGPPHITSIQNSSTNRNLLVGFVQSMDDLMVIVENYVGKTAGEKVESIRYHPGIVRSNHRNTVRIPSIECEVKTISYQNMRFVAFQTKDNLAVYFRGIN
jgi:hypothetical protein